MQFDLGCRALLRVLGLLPNGVEDGERRRDDLDTNLKPVGVSGLTTPGTGRQQLNAGDLELQAPIGVSALADDLERGQIVLLSRRVWGETVLEQIGVGLRPGVRPRLSQPGDQRGEVING